MGCYHNDFHFVYTLKIHIVIMWHIAACNLQERLHDDGFTSTISMALQEMENSYRYNWLGNNHSIPLLHAA